MAFELVNQSGPQPEKTNDSDAFSSSTKMQLKQIGSSGTELFAGYFNEEYLQQLRGRKGAKIYDEMRRSESQVAMLLNAVMNPIKAGTWEFEAADVPNGQLHKELIQYCAKEMIDWETHIHEALTKLIYGFSLFEVVNNVVIGHPKFGTFNGLKALAFRSQKTIERWNIDREIGELKSVTQYVQGDLTPGAAQAQQVEIPAEFILLFSLQKEGDNFEGISALRPMYGPWFRKNLYLKIAAIGVEKNAIGTPIGTIPSGKETSEQVKKFEEILENFTAHESAYITKPAGWEIEFVKNDFNAAQIKELIIMENTEMINSLVANFLALGTGGGGGSFALGTDLSDFFLTGIQNFANIISGVWNRQLIPNLIKLNFGQQEAYPTLKATGINDKAGKELSEVVTALIGSKALTADDKLEEYLRKQFQLPKADPTTARESVPAPAFGGQFSETKIKLAEGYRTQWNRNKASIKEEMQAQLKVMLDDLIKQIEKEYKNSTDSQKTLIGLKLEPKSLAYDKALRELLAKVASEALISARKLTPKAKDVKLSEVLKLAAPTGGFFEALPNNIKRIIKAQAALISQTQAADLNKIVAFQYSSSAASTPNISQIVTDIRNSATPTIEGGTAKGLSIDAAAGNAVGIVFNQAQMEWFFEPEVLETLESFTFFNEDPISEICVALDGTTWSVGDPDLDRYAPPLHHNALLTGSMITTSTGEVEIENIKVGDLVLTHKNQFKKVTEFMDRQEYKEFFEIELSCGKIINITGEHPVLTARGWVQVYDLQLSDDILTLESISNEV